VGLVLAIVREHDILRDQVERADVGATSAQNLGPTSRHPRDEVHAVFSLWDNLAVAMLNQVVGLLQFTEERRQRADVRPMLERIHLAVDASATPADNRSGADRFEALAWVASTLKDGLS
jgi:2-methylcitrate dehydratase PrpD